MSGGSDSSSTNEFKPPSWTTAYEGTTGPWQQYVNTATGLSQRPYESYGGQTMADLSPDQLRGMDITRQTALHGSPDTNMARGMLTDTTEGRWLNSNPYLSSQYTDSVISDNAQNMANAYRLGTGAQTDAAFARGGAFGGSAYNQMQASNAQGLATSVGQMANQYQLQRTGLGAQDYQSERANMMAAAPLSLGGQQMDLQAGQALTGVGDINRSYSQDLLNQGLNAWNAQQQYPYMQQDALGNALARASGNVAGGSTSTSSGGYQASPYAGLLGAGLAAYGAFGS